MNDFMKKANRPLPAEMTLFSLDSVEAPQDGPASPEKTYAAAFRKLYYHLYSNSNASRAERIMSELSNLLLCKVASEKAGNEKTLERFLGGEGSANDILVPMLVKNYPQLVSADEKFLLEDRALRYGLSELAPLSFKLAPAHILGEAFQALMGPRLRGDKGQFFTPRSLVKCIVSILDPAEAAKVVDPACGTGGFLMETHAYQATKRERTPGGGQLIGIDKDCDLSRLSEAILEISAPSRATIINANSLDVDALSRLPEECSPFGADYVLTNPPFGANIKVTEASILSQFALGHRWSSGGDRWQKQEQLRDAQDPQVLFLELCVRLLKPQGKMGIVLPEGVFGNSSLGYVWDFLDAEGEIMALLDCPRTTFQPSTDIKTNVLFFVKSQGPVPPRGGERRVWAAVALSCGHDRRGKSHRTSGESLPDDFAEIGGSYKDRQGGGTLWQEACLTDPYYLVPRYYDSAPLQELTKEAERLGTRLVSLRDMVKQGHIRIRKGHEVGAEAYGTGEVPFVRTSDISNYEVSLDPNRSVSEKVYHEYASQQHLGPGDILLVSDGRYRIGRTAILHEHNYKCVVQSHLRIISVLPSAPITSVELLYLLNLPMVQHQIRNLVFIQSTLGALGGRLNEVCIPLPSQTEEWQRTIADFRHLIEERAKLLNRLHEFEHPGYEL